MKKTLIRKTLLAGLTILLIWVALLSLHGAIPETVITRMNEMNTSHYDVSALSLDSIDWNWNVALWKQVPVSEITGPYTRNLLAFLGLNGVLSLVLAGILLGIGVIVTRFTMKPDWLGKLRSIFGNIFVSGGTAVPLFALSLLVTLLFFLNKEPSIGNDASNALLTLVVLPIVPAWFLVQAGHEELLKYRNRVPVPQLIGLISTRMISRLLRITGFVIVVSAVIVSPLWPELNNRLFEAIVQLDFPTVFMLVFIFSIVIIITRLAADIIEMLLHNRITDSISEDTEETVHSSLLPKGWVIFCSVLAVSTILIAVLAPILAPYGYNEIILNDRLAGPSAEHLLGTDNLGRDTLTRILYGIRLDLFGGLTCAGLIALFTAGWASLAEWLHRKAGRIPSVLETVVMLPVYILKSIPWLVLLLLISVLITLPEKGIFPVVLTVSLILLPRVVTAFRESLKQKTEEENRLTFTLKSLGVILVYIVPACILFMSTLSYKGMGVPPPYPDLGNLLSGTGRMYILDNPSMAWWPLVALTVLTTIWVMAGNVLKEKFGVPCGTPWQKLLE